jgi:hypothetical protein
VDYEVGAMYVSTKVVWQPGHRGASTTVLEPAEGEVLHAMHPATGLRGATMCGVEATTVRGSWSADTPLAKCVPCQNAIDRDVIDLRTVRALEHGD